MFKFLFLILVVMSSVAFSQDSVESEISPKVHKQNSAAEKIDEFGPLGECDRGARMDNFAYKLQENPNAKGYIIFYQGKNELPSQIERPNRAKNLYFNYLVYMRGVQPERLELLDSYREETVTELWLVPQNAAPPKPTATIEKFKVPADKTLLYERSFVENENEFLLPVKKAEYEKSFNADEESSETVEEVKTSEEIKLSDEDSEDSELSWTSDTFGDFLNRNKKMKGVIIFYVDDQEYDINKVKGHIEDGKRKMADEAKISPERIQVIFGGYRNNIEIELWAVPEKGKLPEPTPKERIIEAETESTDR